ncbi:ciliary microtubule associated protein 1A-like [Periplaneta americana]|uniref:ciliary microtubule associated protein 1A-like n=1 Tax=Periplaneta americana TaxID=6978 RepID=UPI0037E787A3
MLSLSSGPGPGNYMLPTTVGYEKHDVTRRRNPAYSMGLKAPADHRKPGPGPYNIKKNQTRFGNDGTPSYSIAGRTGVPVRNINPGPGTYAPERCPLMKETRQPAYTMGGRTPQYKLQQVPAPNQYTVPSYIGPKIPDKQASAAYSMTGRHVGGKEFKSPGPAQYSPPEPNVYKTKLPQYTMTGRTPGVSDRSRNPGPAAYLPTYKHGRSQPQFSFGIRHAETAAPLVLEEDNF